MRTTIDLPSEVLKQVKILAVQRGSALSDLVAAGLWAELARLELEVPVKPALPVILLPANTHVLSTSPVAINEASHLEQAQDDAARLG